MTGLATNEITPGLSGFSTSELSRAYAACRQVARRRARNFYYGLQLVPEPRRSAIFSIYAWMRAADDHVDSAADAGARSSRLAYLAEVTDQILKGGSPSRTEEPYWFAFAATLASYPIPDNTVRDMLAGLEEDLRHEGYRTEEDLDRYCYRVAGTVGIVCLSIWGLRDGVDVDEAYGLAVTRGRAFQRTNILRDFSEDYDSDPKRVYLAEEAFERHALTPSMLRHWNDQRACWLFIREQAAIARKAYQDSAPLERMIDPDCAPAMWSMTRIYSDLLAVIEKDPQRVVGKKRIRLPSRTKAAIAIGARIRGRKQFA